MYAGPGARVSKLHRPYVVGAVIVQAASVLGGCGEAKHNSAPTNASAPATVVEAAPATVRVSGAKRVILAFGDSLYAGYGLARGQSLPDAIQARLRVEGIDATVVNAGVSGDTTAGGRRRLSYTLDRMAHAPDLVMVGLGGNDVLRQVDPTETEINLEAMLAELDRRRIPVVITGMLAPPNLGPDFGARFNAIWPKLAQRHAATLYPFVLDGVIGNRALLLPDGVHPNAKGVSVVADRLAPVLKAQMLKLPDSRRRMK